MALIILTTVTPPLVGFCSLLLPATTQVVNPSDTKSSGQTNIGNSTCHSSAHDKLRTSPFFFILILYLVRFVPNRQFKLSSSIEKSCSVQKLIMQLHLLLPDAKKNAFIPPPTTNIDYHGIIMLYWIKINGKVVVNEWYNGGICSIALELHPPVFTILRPWTVYNCSRKAEWTTASLIKTAPIPFITTALPSATLHYLYNCVQYRSFLRCERAIFIVAASNHNNNRLHIKLQSLHMSADADR